MTTYSGSNSGLHLRLAVALLEDGAPDIADLTAGLATLQRIQAVRRYVREGTVEGVDEEAFTDHHFAEKTGIDLADLPFLVSPLQALLAAEPVRETDRLELSDFFHALGHAMLVSDIQPNTR